MLFNTFLFTLFSVAAANVSCVPQIPPASCSALAAGRPFSPRAEKANCHVAHGALGVLKELGRSATSFCSSYLHVPSATTIPTTVTPAPSTVDVVVTVVTTTTVYGNTNFKKRSNKAPRAAQVHDYRARAVPKCLEKYKVAEISSACSCLKISPHSTVTQTITAPASVTTQSGTITQIATVTTCHATGGPCDCNHPELCCQGACLCNDTRGPVSTCI